MLRYFFLILFSLVFSTAYSQVTENQKDISKSNNQSKPHQTTSNFDTTSLEKTIRDVAKEASNKPDNYSNENLKISRQVKEYTGEITLYTLLIAIVAFLQMILFAFQLGMMRSTMKDSKDAVKAAKDSIDVSREAYIASERPWISVEAKISTDLIKKPEGLEFGIAFTVKNHGVSPAINVLIQYELITLKIAQDQFSGARQRIDSNGIIPEMGVNMGIHVYPGEERVIQWINTLTTKEINEAARDDTTSNKVIPSFYAIGSVFYKSVFDKVIHQTGFNYYVTSKCNPLYPNGSDIPEFTESFPMKCVFLESQPYYKGGIT